MGVVTVYFDVVNDEIPAAPIDDVLIRIFEADDAYLTEGMTGAGGDPPGEASFNLYGVASPGQEYIVRISKDGYSVPAGQTQRIRVLDPQVLPDTNIFDMVVHERAVPESLDPQLCTLYGYLVASNLSPLKSRTVRFLQRSGFPTYVAGGMHYPGDPTVIRNKILISGIDVETDAQGYLEVSLPRGGIYDVHVYGIENPATIIEPIVIPDRASYPLEDILFPYIQIVTFDPTSLSLVVGESKHIAQTVTITNGLTITDAADLQNLLTYVSTAPTVASVAMDTLSTDLIVTGVSSGSATIQVTRTAGTVAPRNPTVPSIITTFPTVGVS